MKIMPCPLNGPRNIQEFICAGPVEPHPDPNRCTDDEWAAFVWMEENRAGVVREWWCHAATSYWFIAERDTVTDEILATYPADRVFTERVSFEPLPSPPPAAPVQESPPPAAPVQESPPPAAPVQESPPPVAPAQDSPPPAAPAEPTTDTPAEAAVPPEAPPAPADAGTEAPAADAAPAGDTPAGDTPADDALPPKPEGSAG